MQSIIYALNVNYATANECKRYTTEKKWFLQIINDSYHTQKPCIETNKMSKMKWEPNWSNNNKLSNYIHRQQASVQYCISSNYNAIYTLQ